MSTDPRDIVERLAEWLPKVGEKENVWTTIWVPNVREAISDIERLRAAAAALHELVEAQIAGQVAFTDDETNAAWVRRWDAAWSVAYSVCCTI